MNTHLNYKYLVFDNWKHAILKVEEAVNNNNNMKEYDSSDFRSRLFLYFIAWNNKNKTSIDLLNYDDIKKLNTILIPGSNIGNFIPFSEFFNLKVNLLSMKILLFAKNAVQIFHLIAQMNKKEMMIFLLNKKKIKYFPE